MGYEPNIIRRQLTDEVLSQELTYLEHEYSMTSEEFLLRFNRGELGDDLAFIRWAGLLNFAAKPRRTRRRRASSIARACCKRDLYTYTQNLVRLLTDIDPLARELYQPFVSAQK
ncbi:MAG: hypothetical protein ACYDCQ_20160 [Dehalococcoidia bacterium]